MIECNASHAPQLRSCNCLIDPAPPSHHWPTLYYMIAHTPRIARNFPIRTLVARRWPTESDVAIGFPKMTLITGVVYSVTSWGITDAIPVYMSTLLF